MATETKKRHNWVTGPNNKVVDPETDQQARAFICATNHLTPAVEAELDNLFAQQRADAEAEDAEDASMVCEPDPEVIETLEAPDDVGWLDVEPTDAALRKIERERVAV